MKLIDLIAKVQLVCPSEYDKDELTQWVNELEFMAVDQVYSYVYGKIGFTPYNYEVDGEKELLIPDQFSDAYVSYISTKIDYFNKEIDRYNVDSAQFEAEWQAFASWYRRSHKPRRRHHAFSEHFPF